jgi:hypothetical protein
VYVAFFYFFMFRTAVPEFIPKLKHESQVDQPRAPELPFADLICSRATALCELAGNL